jgi:hypothetical protein
MSDARVYSSTHKRYDHVGYVVPEVEKSESKYPAGEYQPADWLPVGRLDVKNEEYVVIAAGKCIAMDRNGDVVPAGLKTSFEAAAGSTILTYTANDVARGTIDLTTGSVVALATSYTQNEVTLALRLRGLITATQFARDFVSNPIGYAPYTFFQWAGSGSNPTQYRRHNHTLQHSVAFGTDHVLAMPLVPAQEATETMGDGSISSSAITFGTTQWVDAAGINATTRYSSLVAADDDVVCYVFAKYPVAKITSKTPITDSGSALASKTEVTSIAEVIAGGTDYFYIDYDAGVMFLYELEGNAVPADFSDGVTTITYYTYEDEATGTGETTHAVGNLQVGDFVTFDDLSNYKKWTPDIGTASGGASGNAYSTDPQYGVAADATVSAQLEAAIQDSMTRVVGQVVHIETFPRGGLQKVMSQYIGTEFADYEKMPGTATEGLTSGQVLTSAANQNVFINFINR